LTRDPFGGRISCHSHPDQLPSRVAQNDQAVQQLERDGAHHEQIDRGDPCNVMRKKVF
jgi:hypothetical protein